MSHLFISDDQNTGVSASPPVLPVNIQGWSPLKLKLVWSPCCPRDFQESSPEPQFYMPVTPKSMSLSRTSLLNTIPFHQLPISKWRWQLHLDISEASLSQHIQTRILHYSLILKYTALESPFVVNSFHPLNCLGQRLSRHTDYSTFMSHNCQMSSLCTKYIPIKPLSPNPVTTLIYFFNLIRAVLTNS